MPVAPSEANLGPAPVPSQTPTYAVGRSDGTLRQTLVRWAEQAGWDFGPEHWMVDVDIPITGAANFDVPFIEAVQALVGSTELAVKPLQPCFYSNRVLRIVPYAQACDRTRTAAGQS
ncbi:TcpQ domain-containing protein [Pusillimonas sp. 7-48]|uniref:TcpQ domain-containing protein n=2 Tax=Pusillimonas minor TaxID=2697024 RepID=A0A842HRM3_9BURK|nr:TcpQ domain-containing protein [Pusillimonas minor]